ncbi:hypothetical protein SeGA_2906 [Salmonella enterica subsp. enterica serovar Gaminara str. A4-567]|nr:hypothetical protein SeGA_2906 [Salmonella enterica subsp. enterica serovar Gaminara str. A4-567]
MGVPEAEITRRVDEAEAEITRRVDAASTRR